MAKRPAAPGIDVDRRRQVLEAARTAIAERGLDKLRMTHIAELAGMSPGHILYYFKSKDRILVETLRWSEAEFHELLEADFEAIADAPGRLAHFIAFYVPSGPRDPSWALWLEIHGLALADPELTAGLDKLADAWQHDLADIVALGIRQGHFRPVDAEDFAERFKAMLDGYSIRVAAGHPNFHREDVIRQAIRVAAGELGIAADRLRTAVDP